MGARAALRLQRVEEHVRFENAHDLEGLMSTFGSSGTYDDEPWSEHHQGLDAVRGYYGRAPVRVRAVQGQLDSAPRERDWTIDDRLDLLGARGGTAEKNGNQCVGHAHPRFMTEPSGTSIIGRIRQRPTHGQRDR